MLPTDPICQLVTGTAVIFHLTGRQDRQYVSSLNIILLEIRFHKNLAKLTGSAVRINSKKPKGKKKMKEKKTGNGHAGI